MDLTAAEELARLERIAVEVAEGAAALIHDRPDRIAVSTKTTPTDAVTQMDRASEALLAARLAELAPEDGRYGEEGMSAPSLSGRTWVVDPIDGTVNYLYGLPDYAVSVACVVGDARTGGAWQPIVGAVCAPALGMTYHARAGGGAWRRVGGHDERVSASACADLSLSLVATGFGYAAGRRARQAELLTAVLPEVRDIRRHGSAALDLCRVADGSVDGYYETGLNPWDFAAGWLIAAEAGARVGGPAGNPPCEELTWAAAAGLADALVGLVVPATARIRP